jgi:hypothetical protein
MTLDQLAQDRAADLRGQLDEISLPEPTRVVRRARNRRGAIAAASVAVVAVLLVAALAARGGEPRQVQVASPQAADWREVFTVAAGLPSISMHALASDGTTVIAAGERPGDGRVVVTTWWSTDGLQWTESQHPDVHDSVTAVASHDGTTLAIGAPGGTSAFVWRSTDAGRTWQSIASGPLFGATQPNNRPGAAVDGLTWFDGWWVAWGGAASGYEGIWVSLDGEEWNLVLDSHISGSIDDVAATGDGVLVAYALATGTPVQWRTSDPTNWGAPSAIDLPAGYYLTSVNDNATVAVASQYERHDQPTLVVRSPDTSTWLTDDSFSTQFPQARGGDVVRAGDRDIVIGHDTVDAGEGTRARPGSWVSVGDGTWSAMPAFGLPPDSPPTSFPALPPDAALSLVAANADRVVMMSSGRLDRYYTLDR